MEKALSAFLAADANLLKALARLIGRLRAGHGQESTPGERLRQLIDVLAARPDLCAGLRAGLLRLFVDRHAVLLFATAGIYPGTGLFSETLRRVAHKLLPEVDDDVQLKDALGQVFQAGDAAWLENIAAEEWLPLLRLLHGEPSAEMDGIARLVDDLLEALRIVAHRIAAAGLEPEMLRLDPGLENHASPFLALCEEALRLAGQVAAGDNDASDDSERHLLVLIDQARQVIERVRRRAQQQGASFYLTFRLRRLAQHLDRLERLAAIAGSLDRPEPDGLLGNAAELWRELVIAECRRNELRSFWRENTELVALRVTENAGRSGEHYITTSRADYFAMWRAAAGGGLVIAFMAANKFFIGKLGLAPLAEVLAYCLNYGLGFVLIHILHFAVATKQPAMTANAIAAAIGEVQGGGRDKQRNLDPLVTLVARTVRTQLAAIAGNVGIAVPMAMLIGYGLFLLNGVHLISPEKAHHLLADINPLASGAIVFAAIAGICLFLAGLIAGYYDNLCAYNRIPERLYQLRSPRRFFGAERWRRGCDYIGDNLGALVGNFVFGFLLGGTAGLGSLLGLPLDIRHIAFSSAYLGYAQVALAFSSPWLEVALAAVGVLLIGMTNLAVSFYLAMWVGLKARGVDFAQRVAFTRAIVARLRGRPSEFFLPPGTEDAGEPDGV